MKPGKFDHKKVGWIGIHEAVIRLAQKGRSWRKVRIC